MTEKKKGFREALKGLVFTEDEAPAAPATTPTIVATPRRPTREVPSLVAIPTDVKPDPEALEHLERTTASAAPPAFKEFQEQLTLLSNVISDESLRIKAALVASKNTAENISVDLDGMITAANNALKKVDEAYKSKIAALEGSNRQALVATDDLIASRKAQLKAIEDEIASLTNKKANLLQQQEEESARLSKIHSGYEAAHQQVIAKLSQQKARLPLLKE